MKIANTQLRSSQSEFMVIMPVLPPPLPLLLLLLLAKAMQTVLCRAPKIELGSRLFHAVV
jgi:hypothetical protein